MKKALFITNRFDEIYSTELQDRVKKVVDIIAPPQSSDIVKSNPELLSEVEIIMSGWGAPKIDEEFLAAAPKLEAFFYAGGLLNFPPIAHKRGIVACSAIHANSIPVAEYTLAQIILALKQTHQATCSYRKECAKTYPLGQVAGTYRSKVGIIALGNAGRLIIKLLKNIDVQVLAYDPALTEEEMHKFGAKKVSLEEIFTESDVVSLHAPVLDSTKGMITGKLLNSMKTGATFINTARGVLVREDELVTTLRTRIDLCAILDVTDPEPPAKSSDLWTLPNIVLTPHIAGSHGQERFRVCCNVVDDLERYLKKEPLKWRIQPPAKS